MIKVTLKAGDQIIIDNGKRAYYEEVTRDITTREVIATTLIIKDSDNRYSGNEVANFKAEEVLYYEISEDAEGCE